MAKEYVIKDDLDGTPGAQSHKLTLDGRTVVIDLAEKSYTALSEFLEPYFNAGTAPRGGSGNGASETARVRAWLKANGHEISDKGRIPEDKMALYLKAQEA
jgi:nucleoid-associated protein Lsr2